MTTLALTDHDAIAGVPRPQRRPGGSGSSWCRRSRCPACTSTRKTCISAATGSTWGRSRRPASAPSRSGVTRAGEIVENLRGEGFDLNLDDAIREAGDAHSIGRPHIARAAGATGDLGPFFEEYLVPGAKAFVPRRWPTAEQAIELIHEAGGVAVIAHPYWDISEPGRGRGPDPLARRRRRRDLLPDPQQGADRPPAGALRRARPRPHRPPPTTTARPTRPSPSSAPTTPTASASRAVRPPGSSSRRLR